MRWFKLVPLVVRLSNLFEVTYYLKARFPSFWISTFGGGFGAVGDCAAARRGCKSLSPSFEVVALATEVLLVKELDCWAIVAQM